MNNIVIGIEGLVGSGKTSICRELNKRLPNSIILHGGNLYRGIVYAFMKQNNSNSINSLKNIDITSIMKKLNVKIKLENNETVVYVDGIKIEEDELQNEKTSMAVSIAGNIADNQKLFIFAKNIIDKFKENYNVIVSGRSLMQIYPELDYHFLITASLDERVKRKAMQYKNEVDLEELKNHIIKRDELQEKSGFYKVYLKTIKVDVTDCKNIEESTNKICEYIEETKILK